MPFAAAGPGVLFGILGLAGRAVDRFTGGVFVAGEVQAGVGFALTPGQVARLAGAGGLLGAAQGAYGAGLTGMARADPARPREGNAPSWIPSEKAWIIPPSIDPFSPTNQPLAR